MNDDDTLKSAMSRVQNTIDEIRTIGWRGRLIAWWLQHRLDRLDRDIAEKRDRALRNYFNS